VSGIANPRDRGDFHPNTRIAYEHMFPPRPIQRFATALLEVAEAMLRPVDGDGPADGNTGREPAPHPHRRHRRGAAVRATRRAGTVAGKADAQPCTSPVPRRAERTRARTRAER
jgi:hypothetical protein